MSTPKKKALTVKSRDEFMVLIDRACSDPNFDTEKFQILMQARADERAQQAGYEYGLRMAEVQAQLEPVRRDCSNPQTRSRYASYEALDRAIRPVYSEAGFALSFSTEPSPDPGILLVACKVTCAGHSETHHLPIPIVTKGPKGNEVMTPTHAAMSAKTYGMRGLLQMIFNVALTDDDGNAAGGKDMTPASADQIKRINDLIQETDSDVGLLCQHLQIDGLVGITKDDAGRAIEALQVKKDVHAKKAKQQAEAKP